MPSTVSTPPPSQPELSLQPCRRCTLASQGPSAHSKARSTEAPTNRRCICCKKLGIQPKQKAGLKKNWHKRQRSWVLDTGFIKRKMLERQFLKIGAGSWLKSWARPNGTKSRRLLRGL